jgi:cellulose synthase (UDP-forming)
MQSYAPALGRTVKLPATIRALRKNSHGTEYGLQYELNSETLRNEAVAFAFGDSKRWEFFQMRRTRPMGFGRAASIILSLIWYPILLHTRFIYTHLMERSNARPGLKEHNNA